MKTILLAFVALCSAAFADPVTMPLPTTIYGNKSVTIKASGEIVLNLTDFYLTSGAVVTFQGDENTTFSVNIRRRFLMSGARVLFKGKSVTFNHNGTGPINISQGSTLHGNVNAPGFKLNLTGKSIIRGTVVASQIYVAQGSRIEAP